MYYACACSCYVKHLGLVTTGSSDLGLHRARTQWPAVLTKPLADPHSHADLTAGPQGEPPWLPPVNVGPIPTDDPYFSQESQIILENTMYSDRTAKHTLWYPAGPVQTLNRLQTTARGTTRNTKVGNTAAMHNMHTQAISQKVIKVVVNKSLGSSRLLINHNEIARPFPISWFERSAERPRVGSSWP